MNRVITINLVSQRLSEQFRQLFCPVFDQKKIIGNPQFRIERSVDKVSLYTSSIFRVLFCLKLNISKDIYFGTGGTLPDSDRGSAIFYVLI